MIQATFKHNEKVSDVINFLRQFLADSNLGFYLYTTPPKEVLNPGDTLEAKRLVPAAMVHFGQLATGPALKQDVKAKVTTYRAITEATKKIRGLKDTPANETDSTSGGGGATFSGGASGHAAPVRPAPSEFRTSSASSSSASKVPKWFKTGK